MGQVHEVFEAAAALSKLKGWDKSWSAGGCYLHLEASEFIEALRGKGGDPVDEAGDVLFTLFTMMDYNGIDLDEVLTHLKAKIEDHASREIK